jgi:uncharacterized membrane protein
LRTWRWTAEGEIVATLAQGSPPRHPAVLEQIEARHRHVQVRLADGITAFACSMRFVYIHAVVFAVWMLFLDRTYLILGGG